MTMQELHKWATKRAAENKKRGEKALKQSIENNSIETNALASWYYAKAEVYELVAMKAKQ